MTPSKYPAIAGMASLVEYFKMPRREIEEKFTKSEIFFISWRSQEMSVELTKGMKKAAAPQAGPAPVGDDELPEECYTDGEPDMRKMTQAQVKKYWRSQKANFGE